MSRPRGRPATPTSALVPAAARGDTALGDVEAVLNADAVETFAKAVGGRDHLAEVLAIGGRGSEVERITTLLLDPRYALWSLGRLCGLVGITVADLFACYRKAMIARAHIQATHIIAGRLPPIVTDVMDKALSDPTVERHKLALEVGQLLEKKGGLLVQQNNMAAQLGATAPGALEQLQQAVGDLLFGDRRPPPPYSPDVIVPAPEPDHGDEDEDEHEVNGDDEVTPELPFEQPDSPPRRPERSDPAPTPERP